MVESESLKDRREDKIDEAEEESFPASDPPAWTPLHAGTPDDENAKSRPPKQKVVSLPDSEKDKTTMATKKSIEKEIKELEKD